MPGYEARSTLRHDQARAICIASRKPSASAKGVQWISVRCAKTPAAALEKELKLEARSADVHHSYTSPLVSEAETQIPSRQIAA